MNLRPYQERAIAEARSFVRAGKRAVLFVSPTGSGKTTIASELVRRHLAGGDGRSVLWAAHRVELVEQAAKTLERVGLVVGWGGLRASAPVQVQSIQTILSRGEAPPGTLLVLDEAHHYASEEWKRLPELFAHALRIGLSATPERGDGKGLGSLFDSVVVVAQISELIAQGHLAPCDVIGPRGGTVLARSLAMSPVDAWEKRGAGKSCVVFASSLKAAQQYSDEFRARGIGAEVVSGTMAVDKRRHVLDRFAIGHLKVICNLHVLTEGWDAPIAKCAILARKFGTTGAYLQAVGRILRPHKGERALLIDLFGANVANHGAPDEDRSFDLDGVAIRRAGESADSFCKIHQIPRDEQGRCPECGDVSREVKLPGVAGVDLDKWAGVRTLPETKRVIMLAAFIAKGMRAGHKPTAALFKYKAIFRQFPPPEVRAAAEARARKTIEEERHG